MEATLDTQATRIDRHNGPNLLSASTPLRIDTKYSVHAVGYKKATGKTWDYDDVIEVTPLKELPEKPQPPQPAAK